LTRIELEKIEILANWIDIFKKNKLLSFDLGEIKAGKVIA